LFGKRKEKAYQELEEYRSLMEVPSEFEEGFTLKAFLGVLFVAFIMIPGNMYLKLMIGGNIGAAAEWVTIILFAEIAKRSFTTLKKQEIWVLYYVAGALIAADTGAFEGLMWNQYLVQSPAAKQFGITKLIPHWVAPQPDSPAIINRTFFHRDWVPAILLLVAGMLISRISWFTMGYTLFRLTSDVERLPFPFAPIQAQGAMALAETTTGQETWRWRWFSTGAMIGLAFGAIYVGLPAVTGAVLTEPLQLIPIPWIDLTHVTGNFIPATPIGFTAHLGPIFWGLVAPFWAIVGGFLGVTAHTIVTPLLYKAGYLTHWRQGMGVIETFFVNSVDFWMSFGIGVTLAIAVIGFYQVFSTLARRKGKISLQSTKPPKGRGDFPIWVALGLYTLSTFAIIGIAKILLPDFSRFAWFFLFFGFVYTPIQSFINATLWATVGQTVSIPYVREATIILSGYRGVDIWFVPIPIANYGVTVQKFRVTELTGTKFTSLIKAEAFMVPITLLTSFMYWSYIWKLAPIPSASYPYAQLFWRLRAYQQCLWITGTFRAELKVQGDTVTWQPANLTDRSWWYWRVRAVDMDRLADALIREGKLSQDRRELFVTGKLDRKAAEWALELDGVMGPWSEVRALFTDFEDKGEVPERAKVLPKLKEEVEVLPDLRVELVGPEDGAIVRTAIPELKIRRSGSPEGHRIQYYFEIDLDPTFTSPWKQTSTDEPWLFQAIKPKIIGVGFAIALGSYIVLSLLGLPILLIFGYVRSLTTIPHWMATEIVGALLARYYFWKKYGRQQWRLYAAVLAVGFACGMALTGMAAIAIALIQKSVSVLIF